MQISEIALLLSISQAFFLAIAVFIFQRHSYIGKLLLVFSLSTVVYLYVILTGPSEVTWMRFFLGRVTYLIPGVIWIMAFVLFHHEDRVPLYAWGICATYFLLKAVGQSFYLTNPDLLSNLGIYIVFHIVPQIINIGIYIHTLVLAVLEYRQDLIESRRSLRVLFVATLGTFWLWVCIDVSFDVFVNMGFESLYETGEAVKVVRNVFIFPSILAVNLMLFRINGFNAEISPKSFSNNSLNPNTQNVIDPKDFAVKDKLLEFMGREKPYRKNGLTIGQLAENLGIQEYRLRSVINRVLKYNNFSHFLNKYRIKEAEELLVTSDDSIFSIGMDTGYTSLSSFHKAFKDKHGITPKEYRTLSRAPRTVQSFREAEPEQVAPREPNKVW